jgi:polar amino acid transport system substrate-binding protein
MKKKTTIKSIIIAVIVVAVACAGFFVYKNSQTKEAVKINSVKDIKGKKIGVQLGTTGDIYASDYEKDKSGSKVERYNKGTDATQALIQKKIDCVIIDEQPAKAFVAGNKSLSILKEEFVKEDYAFCVSKNNKELTKKVNKALKKLKANGTIDKINKNYIGKSNEIGKTPYKKKNVAHKNGKLVVATNAAFPPYESYKNGKIVGIDMDIMQAVCDELDMELQIEDMEFDSIITAVQSGKADLGASGMTVTEERKKNIDFTDSYTTSKQVVIVNNGKAAGSTVSIAEKFKSDFVTDNRYEYILSGLKSTIIITILALIIGIVFGSLLAIVRTTHDKNGGLIILNFFAKIYLTIIRGTPTMVQLLIIYYVVFASANVNKIFVAVIAFGLNSSAYVAEVVRSGIMSVDNGQFEAGRSLGLSYSTTMINVILPQAFKNILPALGNELITLLKETSISGYIGLIDLTKGSDIIRSVTYDAIMPLGVVALIYLFIVMLLTAGVNKLERSLRKNEQR